MTSFSTNDRKRSTLQRPDLSFFKQNYPLTTLSLGSLQDREAWLYKIWQKEQFWEQKLSTGATQDRDAITTSLPPSGSVKEGDFELIYSGGLTGFFHAAVLALRYNRSVMVFDPGLFGNFGYSNISSEELNEFEKAGLLSAEELKSVVVNEFDKNVVKFHDASSCIKTPPLLLNGVLDYSVNVDRIVEIIRKKLPKNCVILEQHKFVRCYVRQSSVYLELEDLRQGLRKVYQSRLFIEANGINSPVAQSMDRRRSITHICPTVGTISTGFIKGENPDEVRSSRGEILVSTQDSSNHRQLLWNSFAGKSGQDEYSTYLFFYDSVESQADKSLLSLFESYFDGLNSYKRKSAGWRVIRPMFGYVPSYHHRGWQARRQKSIDRVMILGDLEGLSAPFAFSNLGLNIRDLHQTTHLTSLALEGDLLDAKSLSEIVEFQPTKAQITSLTEFLRPAPKSKASAVNETLNAVMAALQSLDEPTRKEFFRGHLTLRTLKNLLTRTAKLYPGIFQRVREHFGTKGTFLWLANMADAILKERRSGYRSQERDGNRAEQEFARYVLHYKSKPSHHEGQVST